jgi:8-oxo-dGTP pyrophosphatase MutT (NUDIX family)
MHAGVDWVEPLLERGIEPPITPPAAAVAMVFVPGPAVVFIRRAEHPADPWSGHMALPGGRWEPGDADTRAAARRETIEELGFDPDAGRWLGRLEPVLAPVRGDRPRLRIVPHVWALAQRPSLRPNAEVAAVHVFDWARFVRGEGRGRIAWSGPRGTLDLPVVRLDGADIWGITLRIVDDLLRRAGLSPANE